MSGGLLEPAQRKNGKGFKVVGAHLFAKEPRRLGRVAAAGFPA